MGILKPLSLQGRFGEGLIYTLKTFKTSKNLTPLPPFPTREWGF
jgi:hypothetical protein